MADDSSQGLIGDPQEAAEASGRGLRGILASGVSLAMALIFGASKSLPPKEVSRESAAFLNAQTRLVEEQIVSLRAEDPLIAVQLREARLRLWMTRLRLGLLAIVAIASGALFALLIYMAAGAVASRRIVVDAFDVPPSLERKGFSGRVLASRLIDQLAKLRSNTHSAGSPLSASANDSYELKLKVPNTGISLDDIDQMLHAFLSRDIHVDGNLVISPLQTFALTVRGAGILAKTFPAQQNGLDVSTKEAAEYVYGEIEPVAFATYLFTNGRDAQALTFLPGAFERVQSDDDRAKLANAWGNSLSDLGRNSEAIDKYRLAMSLKKFNWIAWDDLVGAVQANNGEEAGWKEAQELLKAARDAPVGHKPEPRAVSNTASLVWDLPLFMNANFEDSRYNGGYGAASQDVASFLVGGYATMHDWSNVARYQLVLDRSDATANADALYRDALQALDQGSNAQIISQFESLRTFLETKPDLQQAYANHLCPLGVAYAIAGRPAEAEAVFANAPKSNDCLGLHGQALFISGDIAGAKRAWQAGVDEGPDIFSVYLDRGVTEMNSGDIPDAIADFRTAHDKAPHFADPLKVWGDALFKQKAWTAAIAKYDEALRYAPAWMALQEARASAAAMIASRRR